MRRWTPWIVAAVALAFLYLIRAVLPPFIIAVILAYILVPGVDALAERLHVRRLIIVGGVYLLFILVLALLFWWLRPTLMVEFRGLRRDSVAVVEEALVRLLGGNQIDLLGMTYDAHTLARALVDRAREALNSPTSAFQFTQSLIERAAEFLLIFIALFYLLLDWESLIAFAFRFVPGEQRERAGELARDIHRILGAYLRGQLILIGFVSAVTWLALRLLFNVPFALPIAVATGFLEIIPLVGPVAAATIAAIAALSTGGTNLAVAVIVFYTALRQFEDQVVAPNVLGRAVHVHPLAAIFAVLAGGALAGPLGLILGVPAAAAVKVILDAMQAPVAPDELPVVHRDGPEGEPGKAPT